MAYRQVPVSDTLSHRWRARGGISRSGIGDADACDVHVEVVIVKGSVLAQDESNDEEQTAKWEKRRQLPALIMAVGCVSACVFLSCIHGRIEHTTPARCAIPPKPGTLSRKRSRPPCSGRRRSSSRRLPTLDQSRVKWNEWGWVSSAHRTSRRT